MVQGMGDNFGKALGSILGRRRSIQKRNRRKILAASFFMDLFKGKGQQLQQGVVDSLNTLNDKWGDITDSQNDLWKDWTDEGRKRLDEYNRRGNKYLNERAANEMKYTDAAIEEGITWENRNDPTVSKEAREALMTSFNAERERALAEINILKTDPRAQFETKTGFNEKAKNAYLAEYNLITKDPTQKGAVRYAFNRAFRTERDKEGNLVSTNAEKIELEEALKKAVAARNKQDANITAAIKAIDSNYSDMVGKIVKTPNEIKALKNKKKILRSPFSKKDIDNQVKEFKNEVFTVYPKDHEFEGRLSNIIRDNVKNAKITVSVINKQKDRLPAEEPLPEGQIGPYPTDEVEIFKNDFQDLVVLNLDGEFDRLSSEQIFRSMAITALAINNTLKKQGKDSLTGMLLQRTVLKQWSKEKRFSKLGGEADEYYTRLKLIAPKKIGVKPYTTWDEDDIVVKLPSEDGYNLVDNIIQTSDAVNIHQSQGGNKPDPLEQIEAYLRSNEFLSGSPQEQKMTIEEIRNKYKNKIPTADLFSVLGF